jgi:hypothetical protein
MAKDHAPAALEALVRVLKHPDAPHSAIVAAANSILDRGYGRPAQTLEHMGSDGGPIMHATLSEEGAAALAEAMGYLGVGHNVGVGGNGVKNN